MAIESASFVTYHCKPSVAFKAEYPLTLADVAITPGVNSRYLLCYEAPSDSNYRSSLVESLKKALESFLAEPREGILALPELLGHIHVDPLNKKHVLRVDEDSAVKFVVSHRDDISFEALEPEKGFPMRCLKSSVFATGLEAFPLPDRNGGIKAFSAQITFIQRGFVICVSKHHFLMDGTAVANLIKWWFKRTRSYLTDQDLKEKEIVPTSRLMALHDKTTLLLDSRVEPLDHPEWKVTPGSGASVFGVLPPPKILQTISKFLPSFIVPRIGNVIFHFTPTSLKQLHSDLQKHTKTRLSINDAVSALIWRCITRARLYSCNQDTYPETSSLAMAVNGRRKLSPPLVDEYFGNCVFFAPSSVPIGVLTSQGSVSLSNVAETIRENLVKKSDDAHMRSLLQLCRAQNKATDMVMAFNIFMGHDLMITSWERFFDSLDDLDVGFGSFMRMRMPDGGVFDGMISVMPAYGMRDSTEESGPEKYPGGMEVAMDLLVRSIESLKKDSEWLRYATWTET